MLQPFEPFLMLPEVKDVNQWRHKDYIYGDPGKFVFTYSHEVSYSAYRNKDVVPELNIDNLDTLLDPRLKGKIVERDASQPNAGSFALAPLYKAKGGEFLTKFLKDQQPKVLDNPQQLDTTLIRGGAAIAFGMQGASYAQCVKDGGCKNIAPVPHLATAVSRGLSIFKNAPNPEATKVFINWLLSKEGQTVMVDEWAKYNITGAVSMRKDVEPHPDHKEFQPDFSDPDQYVWVSKDDGAEAIAAVVRIFKDVMGK
jgi:iron(III) transport system substrate-binding protein